MTGGTTAMIPHWMTFFSSDTFIYAVCMMAASLALIRINDWYSKRKAHHRRIPIA